MQWLCLASALVLFPLQLTGLCLQRLEDIRDKLERLDSGARLEFGVSKAVGEIYH